MATKFKLKKGDRVDFAHNQTPGTITNRVHTSDEPRYRVEWEDGYDNEGMTWHEDDLRVLDD